MAARPTPTRPVSPCCSTRSARGFKGRYGNLVFFGSAQLDEGTMWPTGYAITELSPADEGVIAKLVRKAVGDRGEDA